MSSNEYGNKINKTKRGKKKGANYFCRREWNALTYRSKAYHLHSE